MSNIIHENISLKPYNTFAIDAKARYFATIGTVSALHAVLTNPHWQTLPMLILGGGSNILFTQDFQGLVIHNQIMGIELIDENADHVYLKIGAGENWHAFVLYCIANNYAGVENLSLIPGTMGAAPIQNIGAYGVELKDTLHEVHTISIDDKKNYLFKNSECEFGYRDSIFKKSLKNKHIITHVVLRLNKKPVFHVEYGAIRDKLAGNPLSIKAISDTVIAIRQEKLPDPKKTPNAGSFFKNAIITKEKFLSLQQQFPKLPHFAEPNDCVKIPSAFLIEACGFKGKRFGDVGVHAHQALVLVNYSNGTGAELKALSEKIQRAVMEKFGVGLMTEVNVY